jgi:flagellin
MLSLYTNVAANQAATKLTKSQRALNKSLERLSSGLRINQASDDVAGAGLSAKYDAQVKSLSQAERNVSDALALTQTANGAMTEISDLVSQMRALAVAASDGASTSSERSDIHTEFEALRSELDRIVDVTEFNDTELLAGSGQFTFQVGINGTSNDQISVSFADTNADQIGGSSTKLGSVSLTTTANASSAIDVIDSAIEDIASRVAVIGSAESRLLHTLDHLASTREAVMVARSNIRDTDVAEETANMTRHQIVMQAGISVIAQANSVQSLALSLI